jgi:hypothetical protein
LRESGAMPEQDGYAFASNARTFDESQLLELTFAAGFLICASKFAKALRIAPQAFSAEL